MSKPSKKKLCWSCEGRVPKETENCPYCGVYLSPNGIDTEAKTPSSWAPPYKLTAEETLQSPPMAPYALQNEQDDTSSNLETESQSDSLPIEMKDVLIPLILLLVGSAFCIFSLGLYFYSKNGVFTLSWNSSYWYLYLGIALPMLAIGWKSLSKLK